MLRSIYTLLWLVALPVALIRLLLRGQRESVYRQDICGRLGFGRRVVPRPTIWIHAVSVGETRAAAPLIALLRGRFPDHRMLLTQMTAAGRECAREFYGPEVDVAWLPWDLPWAQRSFLRRWQPRLGIIMETEIWPNLLSECERAGVPVALVNARLSERSAARYARISALVRETLCRFTRIISQTSGDAARFRALGAARVSIAGNMKFDVEPAPLQIARGHAWRRTLQGRPIVLLASTREGEENILLDALTHMLPANALTVIAPRHPQRFDDVAELVTSRSLPVCRRSAGDLPSAAIRVWLGDSMGEMPTWYALADVAIMGGSWLPLGGQNLIEACAAGCPVVVGPHTFNFSQAVDDAIAAGAALRVSDTAHLARTVKQLLGNDLQLKRMSEAGKAFAATHRGAAEQTFTELVSLLPPDQSTDTTT
jgi:3-deoxy-D-manno-octulosonic-acid transferase